MNPGTFLASALFGLALMSPVAGNDSPAMRMGDGTVQGERLDDYEITWLQCARQDGGWVEQGSLTETLDSIGDVLRHTQRSPQPNDVVVIATTYFERNSLAPLRMEQQVIAPDGKELASTVRTLGDDGYLGHVRKDGQLTEIGGTINSNMWHGGALGLPLVTIDAARYPVEFASSMIAFDGTYHTIATLAGRQTLQHSGEPVEALLVDVEWHHNESGDVYPPGPDASGGRFWLVADPPANYPYVPQYRTDTYLVSTLLAGCPQDLPHGANSSR